jgi:DNA-binding IclR family transcriptional regulator
MEPISLSVNEGFDRLQRLLIAMRAGDDLTVPDAAQVTGLNEAVCRAMLEGLERAGLMVQESDGRFVRKPLELIDS